MARSALSQDEYRKIAALHAENIDAGFLSSLGLGFLALLYRCIDECKLSVLFLHEEDEQIVGFVSASQGIRPVYTQLLKHFPTLVWVLLPALFNPVKLKRILELLFSRRQNKTGNAQPYKSELLSIAVDPDYRGKGVAQALYRKLYEYYQEQGVKGFIIVVGEQLTAAHRFYLKSGAHSIDTIQIHRGDNSVVYLQEVAART